MIPIPKLGMAIHNNKRANADNPSGFDFFRGTIVMDAKSHSFSRNPTKLGLDVCDDCVSAIVSSVKEGSSRAASSCAGPRNSGGVPPNPASREGCGSSKTAGLVVAEPATGDRSGRGSSGNLGLNAAPAGAGNTGAAGSETRGRRL